MRSYNRNCPKCGKVITYTTRTGFAGAEQAGTTCRSCANSARWEKKEAEAQKLPVLKCRNCGKDKRADAFSKHAQCRTGYDLSRCKDCKKAAHDYHSTSYESRIWNRCKSRAKRKGLAFNIAVDDILIPEVCPVFGLPLVHGDKDWTPSLDRIDPAKGYIKGNVAIMSIKANRIKNDARAEDLRKIADWMDANS